MTAIVISKHKDAAEVAESAAKDLADELVRLLSSQERVSLVLTGGTVGIKTLSYLATFLQGHDLSKLLIYWGDERFVESTSADRNSVQAKDAFLAKVAIPPKNIHEMPSSDVGDLETAAKSFSLQFGTENPSFDIVLLGMGADGHVASLFPNSAPSVFGRWVVAVPNSPKPPSQRISMSFEALSSANEVWFLVAGQDKAEAVSKVFGGEALPAGMVHGKTFTRWYLDEAAAAEITS